MSAFLSETELHILEHIAPKIPSMITDPTERENVLILYELLQKHVERNAALEAVLWAFLADDGSAFKERDVCYFCDAVTFAQEHAPDCPIVQARALLGDS